MTPSERAWKNRFERQWEREELSRAAHQKDIMNKGVRYGTEFEEPIVMSQVDQYGRSSVADNYVKRLLNNGKSGSRGDYSPRDYFAFPEQWFTHKWTDTIDKLVDKQRHRDGVFDSNIPGIIYKDSFWEVNRFFEGESMMLGRFVDLEEAKAALASYNKKITKSGYGVDYT